MAKNDKIILDKLLDERRDLLASSMTHPEYFEVFVAEQILKDQDLSYEEIQRGIVGGGNDGGVDSIYLFVNGNLIEEFRQAHVDQKKVSIELVMFQAKTSGGFALNQMDKFIATTKDLFDFQKPLSTLKDRYNSGLLEAAELFRSTYQNLAGKLPEVSIRYHYATKSDEIHPNLVAKADELESLVESLFSPVSTNVVFHTASSLVELTRRVPKTTRTLSLSENPISAPLGEAFIGLARLKDYYDFITDDEMLASHIFEANVRDYQGDIDVNKKIKQTLETTTVEDFWWLNNGVTILASRVAYAGKTLTIENPEIVNGLQTSREIFEHFSKESTKMEERNILIRVVVPTANESRYHIIKATNSQTSIGAASLRATDKIHRDIEDYLRSYQIYYDRRKNFYKNQRKPISRILSISKLAQSVAAILLQRPNDARARPSTLINEEEVYKQLFNPDYPIELYKACFDIIISVESFLKEHSDNLEAFQKNDLKFYVAMAVANQLCGRTDPSAEDIAALSSVHIGDDELEQAYQLAKQNYESLGGDNTVAKGSNMLSQMKSDMTQARLI